MAQKTEQDIGVNIAQIDDDADEQPTAMDMERISRGLQMFRRLERANAQSGLRFRSEPYGGY